MKMKKMISGLCAFALVIAILISVFPISAFADDAGLSGSLSITGSTKVGSTLNAVFTPDVTTATYAYRWYRDSDVIAGASASSYTVTAEDKGYILFCEVYGTGSCSGSIKAYTNPIYAQGAAVRGVVIYGIAKVGQTLTAVTSTSGAPASWKWYRNGSEIANAKSASYTVAANDLNAVIWVTATGTYGGMATASAGTVAAADSPAISVTNTVTVAAGNGGGVLVNIESLSADAVLEVTVPAGLEIVGYPDQSDATIGRYIKSVDVTTSDEDITKLRYTYNQAVTSFGFTVTVKPFSKLLHNTRLPINTKFYYDGENCIHAGSAVTVTNISSQAGASGYLRPSAVSSTSSQYAVAESVYHAFAPTISVYSSTSHTPGRLEHYDYRSIEAVYPLAADGTSVPIPVIQSGEAYTEMAESTAYTFTNKAGDAVTAIYYANYAVQNSTGTGITYCGPVIAYTLNSQSKLAAGESYSAVFDGTNIYLRFDNPVPGVYWPDYRAQINFTTEDAEKITQWSTAADPAPGTYKAYYIRFYEEGLKSMLTLSGSWNAYYSNQNTKNALVPIDNSNSFYSRLTNHFEGDITSFTVSYDIEEKAGVDEVYFYKTNSVVGTGTTVTYRYRTKGGVTGEGTIPSSQSFVLRKESNYVDGDFITSLEVTYAMKNGSYLPKGTAEQNLLYFQMWNPERLEAAGNITQRITGVAYQADGDTQTENQSQNLYARQDSYTYLPYATIYPETPVVTPTSYKVGDEIQISFSPSDWTNYGSTYNPTYYILMPKGYRYVEGSFEAGSNGGVYVTGRTYTITTRPVALGGRDYNLYTIAYTDGIIKQAYAQIKVKFQVTSFIDMSGANVKLPAALFCDNGADKYDQDFGKSFASRYKSDSASYWVSEQTAGFDINGDGDTSDSFAKPYTMPTAALELSYALVVDGETGKEVYLPNETGTYRSIIYNRTQNDTGEAVIYLPLAKEGDVNNSQFTVLLNGAVTLTGGDFSLATTKVEYSADGLVWAGSFDDYASVRHIRIICEKLTSGELNEAAIPFKVGEIRAGVTTSAPSYICTQVNYVNSSGIAGETNGINSIYVQRIRLTGSVNISGIRRVDETLIASAELTNSLAPGDATPSYRWQWYRDGEAIGGADGNAYTLTNNDYAHEISVEITGYGNYYGTVLASVAGDEISATISGSVVVEGLPMVKQTLTANVDAVIPNNAALIYQWYRDGEAIGGATSQTYTVTAADIDSMLHVRVTGSGTSAGSVDSLPVGPVDANRPTVFVRGDQIVVSNNNSELFKISYQWTGGTATPYTTWAKYVKNGIYKTAWSPVEADEKLLDVYGGSGWYTVLAFYQNDSQVFITDCVYVGAPNVSSSGLKISYTDSNNTMGAVSKYLYRYNGNTNPNITNWTQFNKGPHSIVKPVAGTVDFDFIVDQSGWYTVCVIARNGARYYNVWVQERAPETNYRPRLSITYDEVTVVDDQAAIVAAYFVKGVAKTASEFEDLYHASGAVKGYAPSDTVVVNEIGEYTIRAIDENGVAYYLIANIRQRHGDVLLDDSALRTMLETAENLLKSTGVSIDGKYDASGIKMNTGSQYVLPSVHDALFSVLQKAQNVLMSAVVQKEYDDAVSMLQSGISAYTAKLLYVGLQFVSANGSTVTVSVPEGLGGSITKVLYNSDTSKTKLIRSISQNWVTFAVNSYITDRNASFTLKNVPDGVYTLVVFHTDQNGKETVYYEDVAVSGSGSINPETVSLLDMVARAQILLDSNPNCSVRTTLLSELSAARATSADHGADFNGIILAARRLTSAMVAFNQVAGGSAPVETPVARHSHKTISQDTGAFYVSSVDVNGNHDLISVAYARGAYDKWATFSRIGYQSIQALANHDVSFTVSTNGIYTLLLKYKDGTAEYIQVTVTGISVPFSMSDQNGSIQIAYNLDNIAVMGYAYGAVFDYASAAFIRFQEPSESLTALGNGVHTVFVQRRDGTVYYDTIDITSCIVPVAIPNGKTAFTAYAYGFDILTVAYAKGEYRNWMDMYEQATYISLNSRVDCTGFASGTYTVCFTTKNGTEYFVPFTVQ